MTLEELQHSDVVKQWIGELLKNKTFSAILDAIQARALPSSSKSPAAVPGVHYDTTLAHDLHYYAGWSDCIEFIRRIPGNDPVRYEEEQEEEFSYLPEIRAIDAELKQAAQAPKVSTPPNRKKR